MADRASRFVDTIEDEPTEENTGIIFNSEVDIEERELVKPVEPGEDNA